MAKKLLFVNACVRGSKSRTLELCREYIETFLSETKLLGVEYILEEVVLGSSWENAFETGASYVSDSGLIPQVASILDRRDKLMMEDKLGDHMFDFARQFVEADHIVIGAPYWDLQFPAVLKIYLERISIPDLTYVYDETGIPKGKSKIEGGVYVMTAGGFTTGMNFGYDYVNGLFEHLFVLPKLSLVKAEGIDIAGANAYTILNEAKKDARCKAKAAAATH